MEGGVQRRRLVTVLTGAALLLASMSTAGAAPDKKSFTTTITPATAVAGISASFDLTITNISDSAPLGAAEITIPNGFGLNGAMVETGGWSVLGVSTSTVRVVADSVNTRLGPGGSVTVELDLDVALNSGGADRSYPFVVAARQANNFNGARNDLNPPRDPASMLVTGTATQCERGSSCQAQFSSGRVLASVTTVCVAEECGKLTLDLDKSYCDSPATCAGEGVLWLPPAVDPGQQVNLVVTVPKSEFAQPAPGLITFYIAPTGSPTAVVCGSAADTTGCSYKVMPKGADLEIQVTVGQVDPRGFVS